MRITMVKKTLADGSDCRKCAEATEHLQSRGLWHHIDEVVWAREGDPTSPGMVLGARFGVERAPFFIVRDEDGRETVYSSVLQLVRERLGQTVSLQQQAQAIDIDDVGGI
jgi:hypothetical protein